MRIFRKGEGDFGRSTAKNDRQHVLAGNTPPVMLLSFAFQLHSATFISVFSYR